MTDTCGISSRLLNASPEFTCGSYFYRVCITAPMYACVFCAVFMEGLNPKLMTLFLSINRLGIESLSAGVRFLFTSANAWYLSRLRLGHVLVWHYGSSSDARHLAVSLANRTEPPMEDSMLFLNHMVYVTLFARILATCVFLPALSLTPPLIQHAFSAGRWTL